MQLSAPTFYLKRQAKRMARARGIPLHAALDKIAAAEGFQAWSHLSSRRARGPAGQVLDALELGDMALVAARPGQGKTLLSLEVLSAAGNAGRSGVVFSLDYSAKELRERFESVGGAAGGRVRLDTSDEICAGYIIAALEGAAPGTVAVVDYLQLLDQRRSTPPLDQQVAALSAFARRSGVILLCISQVDRRFDTAVKTLPDLDDIRLPNPADLGLFRWTVFLHEGQVHLMDCARDT